MTRSGFKTLKVIPAKAGLFDLLGVAPFVQILFAEKFPAECEVVQLRFFAGLTMDKVAKALGITRRTAQRHWAFAKGKLSQLMNDS